MIDDTGTVLSEAPWSCESAIVFGDKPGMEHWKPDPVHLVATELCYSYVTQYI